MRDGWWPTFASRRRWRTPQSRGKKWGRRMWHRDELPHICPLGIFASRKILLADKCGPLAFAFLYLGWGRVAHSFARRRVGILLLDSASPRGCPILAALSQDGCHPRR